MPPGYNVAPNGEDIAAEVIAAHSWDLWQLCTYSRCYDPSCNGGCVTNDGRLWETNDTTGDYRIAPSAEGKYQLLLRMECVPSSAQSIAPSSAACLPTVLVDEQVGQSYVPQFGTLDYPCKGGRTAQRSYRLEWGGQGGHFIQFAAACITGSGFSDSSMSIAIEDVSVTLGGLFAVGQNQGCS
eukprot:gene56640-biopygen102335